MIAPTLIPPCQLPTGSSVRKVIWIANQSNNVGASPVFVTPNTDTPHLYYTYEQNESRPGIFQRNGAMFGNQASLQVKYKGSQQKTDIDLKAAGKKPIFGTIARSGTFIEYFINGGLGQATFQQKISQLVNQAGSADWNVVQIGGESDANTLLTSVNYTTNLTSLFDQNIDPYMPGARAYIVLLNVNYSGPDATWRTNVRACQTAFVGGRANSELLNWDAFGYASPHYDNTGYDQGGANIAARVLAYQP